MLQPTQLRVNSENAKKPTKVSHGEERRSTMGFYHSGLVFFKER